MRDTQYEEYRKALDEALKEAEESRPMHEDAILRACEEAFQAGYRAGVRAIVITTDKPWEKR